MSVPKDSPIDGILAEIQKLAFKAAEAGFIVNINYDDKDSIGVSALYLGPDEVDPESQPESDK